MRSGLFAMVRSEGWSGLPGCRRRQAHKCRLYHAFAAIKSLTPIAAASVLRLQSLLPAEKL